MFSLLANPLKIPDEGPDRKQDEQNIKIRPSIRGPYFFSKKKNKKIS